MIDIYFGTGNGARALCATRPLFVIRVYAWENSEGWGRSHHHLRKVYRTSRLREGRRRRRRRRLAGAARVTRLEHLFFPDKYCSRISLHEGGRPWRRPTRQ